MNGLGYDIELTGLLIAMAVGLIIGFERGWQSQNLDGARHEEIDDQTVTGIRTFGLLGLAGGVVAQLGILSSRWVLAAALPGVTALLLAGYTHTSRAAGGRGATTEAAALLASLLRARAVPAPSPGAAAAAVVAAVPPAPTERLPAPLRTLSRLALRASLPLLVIVLVVLPLLPKQ